MDSAITAIQEVFIYTGQERAAIPDDVTHIRVDPSIKRIPPRAFERLRKLEEVEICEGVEDVGEDAFFDCESLRNITIPSTVTRILKYAFCKCTQLEEVELREGLLEIGAGAFSWCAIKNFTIPNTVRVIGASAFRSPDTLTSVNLPDGLESIGESTFRDTRLRIMRIPPLVTKIPRSAFASTSDILFSVELPEGINRISGQAFFNCLSLRNIAIPPNAVVDNDAFNFEGVGATDLGKVFGSASRIGGKMQHRFDGLPIHEMMYHQSYHTAETTLENLNSTMNLRSGQCRKLRSKLNRTGNQQDCLGMTPLHILACSAKPNLAIFRLIVEKYPENLITEDKWGALPILYALWGDAPSEIVQFLVESHKTRYPGHELNWGKMMETLSMSSSLNSVKNLFRVQRNSFPGQSIEWEIELSEVLDKMDEKFRMSYPDAVKTYRFLLHYSISRRLNSIGVKQWRDIVMKKINCCHIDGRINRCSVYSTLFDYETEYGKLKETTSILELALWKQKINEPNLGQHMQMRRNRRKKMKTDAESEYRQQCRISCGAETVIYNVLPFLLSASFRSSPPGDDDDDDEACSLAEYETNFEDEDESDSEDEE